MTMASFVLSQRGVFKLHYEGFIYVKQKENESRTLWRCEKYRKCRGRASSIDGNVIITADHSHDPDYHMCEAATVLAKIKAQSVSTQDAPENIVSKALSGLSEEVLVKIPKIVSLIKAVSRAKQRTAETPRDKAFQLLIGGQPMQVCERPVTPSDRESYIIRSQQEEQIDPQKQNPTARISTKIPPTRQEVSYEGRCSVPLSSVGGVEETYIITTLDGKVSSISRTLSNNDERDTTQTDSYNTVLQDNSCVCTEEISDAVRRDEHLIYCDYIADRFSKCNRNRAEIDVAMKLIDGIMFNLATGIYSCLSSPATNEVDGLREKGPSLSTPASYASVLP